MRRRAHRHRRRAFRGPGRRTRGGRCARGGTSLPTDRSRSSSAGSDTTRAWTTCFAPCRSSRTSTSCSSAAARSGTRRGRWRRSSASRAASSSRAMWPTAIYRHATPRATCSCCRRTRGPRRSARRSWKPWRPACRSSARRFRRARRGSTRTASPASSSRRAIRARLRAPWPPLVADPVRREALGRAGRARASRMFEAATMVEAVEEVYREVLARPAGSGQLGADHE